MKFASQQGMLPSLPTFVDAWERGDVDLRCLTAQRRSKEFAEVNERIEGDKMPRKSSRERSRPGNPYPVREVSMSVVNSCSTTLDDVSPWPQADRVNLTQGELAEDHYFLSSNRQNGASMLM